MFLKNRTGNGITIVFFRENKFTMCLEVPYSAVNFFVLQCIKWRVSMLKDHENTVPPEARAERDKAATGTIRQIAGLCSLPL